MEDTVAKEETFEDSLETKLDDFEGVQTQPSDSTTEDSVEDTETEKTEEPSAEDVKTEAPEEKETEVPKEFHKHPAWQRIMKERDEARTDKDESSKKYADFESKLAEFDRVMSSPSYIRESMRSQGYTQDAIDGKLTELGHSVEAKPQDDIKLVMDKLNIDPTNLNEEAKNYINTYVADAAKVADIIVADRLEKALAEKLGPIQSSIKQFDHSSNVDNAFSEMRKSIEGTKILDFDKDVKPQLTEFADTYEKGGGDIASDAFLGELVAKFKDINFNLTVERLQGKNKQDDRDVKKESLRSNQPGQTVAPGDMPQRKEGQNIDSYMNDLLDAGGILT